MKGMLSALSSLTEHLNFRLRHKSLEGHGRRRVVSGHEGVFPAIGSYGRAAVVRYKDPFQAAMTLKFSVWLPPCRIPIVPFLWICTATSAAVGLLQWLRRDGPSGSIGSTMSITHRHSGVQLLASVWRHHVCCAGCVAAMIMVGSGSLNPEAQ